MTEKSRLRRSLSRWASSSDMHARELRRDLGDTAEASIAQAPDRQPVTVQGVVKTITLRPRGGVPALEAELDDGSAVLTVVWLGRRQIAGIGPGRSMRVSGRIGVGDGHRIMYNPRYELLP
ncbi:MAG: OB-fold nucleic acid binding domain-containing protein [Nocardioides sp.]